MNPFTPVMKPISKNAKNIDPSITPAAPAIIPEIANVYAVIRVRFAPISCVVSGSWATACMAMPVRVCLRNSCSAPMMARPMTMIQNNCGEMRTPANA